jgi:hypothetical protein
MVASSASRRPAGEDYYEKLGVTKIINAAGTYTNLTASIMPDSVQTAVARAAARRWNAHQKDVVISARWRHRIHPELLLPL